MTSTDYLLNGVLVLMVVLQLRGRRLSPQLLLLPLALVGYVAIHYLHSIPTAGNDLVMAIAGAVVGVLLGTSCGLTTRVFRRDDGAIMSKATGIAAFLWVAGVGARLAFALHSEHGGGEAIVHFSHQHDITSPDAWVACLLLMAIMEALSRTAVIAQRAWRLRAVRPGQAAPAAIGAIMASGDR